MNQAKINFHINQYSKAIDCLNRAIEEREDLKEAYFLKGRCLYKIGKISDAIKCFDSAIELNHVRAHNFKGFLILDSTESKKYFERALQLNQNPKNAQDYKIKGESLRYLNKNQEAIECYNKAIHLNPNDAETFKNKGDALHETGKYEEAINCIDLSIKLNANRDTANTTP